MSVLAQLTVVMLVTHAFVRAHRIQTLTMTRACYYGFGLHLRTLVDVLRAVRALPTFGTVTFEKIRSGQRYAWLGRICGGHVCQIVARGTVLARLVQFAIVDADLAVLAFVAHWTHAFVGELLGFVDRRHVKTRGSVATWCC